MDIVLRRDPNHHSKKIEKDGCFLEFSHPELAGLGRLLKAHFLITIKIKLDDDAWTKAWFSFIGHNFTNDHNACAHGPVADDYEVRFADTSKSAIEDVRSLLLAIGDNASLFNHGTHTNTNEALNGAGHARSHKRLQRTVSGARLFAICCDSYDIYTFSLFLRRTDDGYSLP